MEVNVHGGKVKDRKGIIVALLIISIIVFLPTLFFTKSLSGKTVGGSSGQVETNNPTNGNLNGGTSSGGNGNSNTAMHTHNYYKEIVQNKYLKSAATCTAKAVYYFSCECGEKGEQTFEYGDKLSHTFDKQVAEEKYLKSAATCTAKAVYYYSCKCGLASDSETFEYGEILPHEFNNAYICTDCSYKCKSDGLSFELSTDNNSYVCTGLGTFNGKILIIPSEYNGKPVTKIEEDAFKNATDITDVLIPDSVTEVGFNAFGGCSHIAKMVLPFVGAYADGSGDENIGYIFGASSYDEQGQKLPSGLKTVVLSDTTTKIGDYAFKYCSSLTSVTIPDSVTSIGRDAFGYSTKIYYNGDINDWAQIDRSDILSSECVYINGELLSEVVMVMIDNATEINSYAFSYCNKLTSVTIGNGVTSIGYGAFRNCTSLTSVTIPDSVTRIGGSAFENCTSLKNISIGNGVTDIGGFAFRGCTSLEFNKYDNGLYLGNGTNKYLVLVKPKTYGIKNITINDGCKIIAGSSGIVGGGAFHNCSSLTSVTIPDSVTSIGGHAFYGCSSLKTINYKGGKEQWNSISKGVWWDDDTGNYTINYNYVEN